MSLKYCLVAAGVVGGLLAPATANAAPAGKPVPAVKTVTAVKAAAAKATVKAVPVRATVKAVPVRATVKAVPVRATVKAAPGKVVVKAAAADLSDQDTAFLVTVHQANLAEIAGGNIAELKGRHSRISALAARFVSDHTAMDAQLTEVATALGVTLPDAPTAGQQALAQRYTNATPGLAFERLWVSTQLYAHAEALVLGAKESATGQDPQVVQLAKDGAPTVTAHKNKLVKVEVVLYNGSYGMNSRHPLSVTR